MRIDHNLCENAIRPFVTGRKSGFANSVAGANASANLIKPGGNGQSQGT
ncbi:MAG: transposase [Granulosicoccus sp.]|nr:transposase [Granulosicoccus sp.]